MHLLDGGRDYAAKTNINKKCLCQRTTKGESNELTQAFLCYVASEEVESPPWDGWSQNLVRGEALENLVETSFLFGTHFFWPDKPTRNF